MCGCHTVDVENTLLGGNTLLTNPDVRRGTHIHRPSTSVRMDSISAAGTAPAAAEVPDPPTYRQMYIPYRTGTSADAVRLPIHCRVAKWKVFGAYPLLPAMIGLTARPRCIQQCTHEAWLFFSFFFFRGRSQLQHEVIQTRLQKETAGQSTENKEQRTKNRDWRDWRRETKKPKLVQALVITHQPCRIAK